MTQVRFSPGPIFFFFSPSLPVNVKNNANKIMLISPVTVGDSADDPEALMATQVKSPVPVLDILLNELILGQYGGNNMFYFLFFSTIIHMKE